MGEGGGEGVDEERRVAKVPIAKRYWEEGRDSRQRHRRHNLLRGRRVEVTLAVRLDAVLRRYGHGRGRARVHELHGDHELLVVAEGDAQPHKRAQVDLQHTISICERCVVGRAS